MNIKTYGAALLDWADIDDGNAEDILRRIVLMGNGFLYAAKTNGDLYQWVGDTWKQINVGNQQIGMSIPKHEPYPRKGQIGNE